MIENAEIVCYADDTAIIFHGSTWQEAQSYAEKGMKQVSEWLVNNLLTLNTSKTVYMHFHKTAASAPGNLINIKIHDTSCLSKNCKCESLNRVNVIKYLGVHIDEKLTFDKHIDALSTRIRRVTGIMRELRNVACFSTLKSVYFALCQSLITYCIKCWGSATKTFMIRVERAQRSILKVLLHKPLRYPTSELYKNCGVLTVRQLFILRTSLSVHKTVLASPEYSAMLKRRIYRLATPPVKTVLARRFGEFVKAYVYNSVLKHCNIKDMTVVEAKHTIHKWLSMLTYDGTEKLLQILT